MTIRPSPSAFHDKATIKPALVRNHDLSPRAALASVAPAMQVVNSRHLCHKPGRNRAKARLVGQNGRRTTPRFFVRALGCKKARGKGTSAAAEAAEPAR